VEKYWTKLKIADVSLSLGGGVSFLLSSDGKLLSLFPVMLLPLDPGTLSLLSPEFSGGWKVEVVELPSFFSTSKLLHSDAEQQVIKVSVSLDGSLNQQSMTCLWGAMPNFLKIVFFKSP
jgi:hypothetical protein